MDVPRLILATLSFLEACADRMRFEKRFVDEEINVYKDTELSFGSKSECASACFNSDDCHSFQFNRNTGRCFTHPVSFEALWENNVVTQTGNDVYHRIWSDALGARCTSDTDCGTLDSACLNGACNCHPGYSYRLSANDCVTSCAVYGTEMLIYPGHGITFNNMATLTVTNLEECVSECVSTGSCRSFDYNPTQRKCFLQNIGFLDSPDDQVIGGTMIYGHRNCGP